MKIGDFVTVKIPKELKEEDSRYLKNYLNIIFKVTDKRAMDTRCLHVYQEMSYWNKEPLLYDLLSVDDTRMILASDFLQLISDERVLDTIF